MNVEERLQPYLAPDYWQGHMFGDGDAAGRPAYDQVYARSLNYLYRELPRRLNGRSVVFPLETYSDGEAFDVHSYEPGTVLLFRDEMLQVGEGASQGPGSFAPDQSVLLRPYDVTPYVSAEHSMTYLRGAYADYMTVGMWGMVVPTKDGKRTVVSTPIFNVRPDQKGTIKVVDPKIFYGAPSTPLSFPSRIGETSHYALRSGAEILGRVNILQVIAYGQTERKKRIFSMGARLAVHGA